jgi:hypothetical protein
MKGRFQGFHTRKFSVSWEADAERVAHGRGRPPNGIVFLDKTLRKKQVFRTCDLFCLQNLQKTGGDRRRDTRKCL